MSADAVVLLSGGLDSATVLAAARAEGRACIALSFDYGQRHRAELDAADAVARSLGAARHVVFPIDLRRFGGSALTGTTPVPKRDAGQPAPPGVPVTYVPARNLVMLAVATACAETVGAGEVWIGVNALDYSGYPDCRPEFIEAFQRAATLATRVGTEGRGLVMRAPLMHLTKAEIIRLGVRLGVDFGLTRSCYDPDDRGRACGRCDSCHLRREGFNAAGVADPTVYTV